jgi:RNA polymerase sigma-54 factor
MTPQLQQAIRMLQLSTIELQEEVQEILESNPLLEEGEGEESGEQTESSSTEKEAKTTDTPSAESEQKIPDELDSGNWEDSFDDTPSSMLSSSSSGERDDNFEAHEIHSVSMSLHEHLTWQLDGIPLSERDYTISISLIDEINQKGYLESSLEDMLSLFDFDPIVEVEEITTQLHQIQQFDPPGIGARNLRECLLIQLRQITSGIINSKIPDLDPAIIKLALKWVEHNFDLISEQNIKLLCSKLKANENTLTQAIALIRTLDPHPGEQIEPEKVDYVIPDLFVHKKDGHWEIELTSETSPKLRISPFYEGIKGQAKSSADKEYISSNIQEARWFLKSLQNRNETLFKVASHIFQVQLGFLEGGAEKMKALTLRTIAEAVEMHESTISRVTTNKYVQTPQGLFELKYFFSSQLTTTDGDGASATAVRAMISKIIKGEDPAKPTSDNRITQLLAENGVKVARRTVAKYRDILSIPPSNERKRAL